MHLITKKNELKGVKVKNKNINGKKDNEEEKNNNNINDIPYTQAVREDKRNIFQIFISVIIKKIELINLFMGDEKFKEILICEYITSLLITFFFNTLLYSDEIVSHKYHNNGKLDFF